MIDLLYFAIHLRKRTQGVLTSASLNTLPSQVDDDHHSRKPAHDITSQLEINFGDLGRPGRGRGGARGGRGGRGGGGGATRPPRGGRTERVNTTPHYDDDDDDEPRCTSAVVFVSVWVFVQLDV